MTQQPGRDLAPIEQVRSLIFANQKQLTAAMPSHLKEQAAGWFAGAYAAVQRNPDLIGAIMTSPHTFTNALNQAAQLGLTPGTEQYYLTPRKNKGRQEILGVVGYQGHIELMYRAGAVASVIAEVVHENDEYSYVRGEQDRPRHVIPGGNFGSRGARGKLIGVYAYAIMKDGAVSRVVEMNADDIADVKRTSAGSDSESSPWKKWEKAMWLKSAVHQLEKWVPTSAEYAREQIRAQVDGSKGTKSITQAEKDTPNAVPTPGTPPANQPPTGDLQDLGEHQPPAGTDPHTGEAPEGYDPTAPEPFENDPTAEAWGLRDQNRN